MIVIDRFFHGGVTGNRLQKTVIEAGDVYNLTGGAWQEKDIPNGSYFPYTTNVLGNFVYGASNGVFIERDLSDNSQKIYVIPRPSAVESLAVAFSYNNQLYCAGFTASGGYLVIYRINLSTLTMTLVATSTFAYRISYGLTKQVTETKFIFVSTSGIVEFDFWDNSFKQLLAAPAPNFVFAIQKATNGDYYIGTCEGGTQADTLHVYKYFTSTGGLSNKLGTIPLSVKISHLQTIQLGEKLMYVSKELIHGKYTGELDLINLTLNTNKYSDAPKEVVGGTFNLFEYQNQYIYYAASKKYWLPLTQTPPEQNALVMKIFKGQKYSTIHGELHINALAAIGQAAFDITTHQQTAAKNLYIYFGMYQLNSDLKILIEGK